MSHVPHIFDAGTKILHDPMNENFQFLVDALVTGTNSYAIDTGTVNAYVGNFISSEVYYTIGKILVLKAIHTNTGDSTLDAGHGPLSIINSDGGVLSANTIRSGGLYLFAYNGTNFTLISGTITQNAINTKDRSFLEFMPLSVQLAVIAGTNTADLSAYLNAAFATGGYFTGRGLTYLNSGNLNLNVPGTYFDNATFKLIAGTPTNTIHVKINADNIGWGDNVVIDGNNVGSSTITHTGVGNVKAINGLRVRGIVKNHSFNNINISDNQETWVNDNIDIRIILVDNCGWVGIGAYGCKHLTVIGQVTTTGYHVTDFERNDDCYFDIYVSKAIGPSYVYSGPGSLGGIESGAGCIRYRNKRAIYNIRAYDFLTFVTVRGGIALDTFMLGEGYPIGPEPDLEVINGYIVDCAATFADFTSGSTGRLSMKSTNPAYGFNLITKDRGGILHNIDMEIMTEGFQTGLTFGATIPINISITTTLNSASVAVADITNVLVGQYITAPTIPAGKTIIAVTPGIGVAGTITLSGGGTGVTAGTGTVASVKGVLNFSNIYVNHKAYDGNLGLYISDDGSTGFASFDNIEVAGNYKDCITSFSVAIPPAGFILSARRVTPLPQLLENVYTYTPTITSVGGTPPTVTNVVGEYVYGPYKTVTVTIYFTITAVNAGTIFLLGTLPPNFLTDTVKKTPGTYVGGSNAYVLYALDNRLELHDPSGAYPSGLTTGDYTWQCTYKVR